MNSDTPRYKVWLAYLAVTLFYCRAIFSHQLLFALGGDEVHSIYGSMVYFHEWVNRGAIPLWNMLSACGAPFGAGSISIGNMYYVAARYLEAGTAYNTVIFISIWLNGIFLYEFLLRKGRSPFAAWIGGLTWMICTASAIDSGFFFLSLSFLLVEIYASKKSRFVYILLVASLTFYAVNAHPQYFLYGSFFLWVYLISKSFQPARAMPKTMVLSLAPFLVALGLSSFHWSRLAEWTLLSNRSTWTLVQSCLPTHYPLVLFPNLYHLAGRPDLDYVVPRIFQYFFLKIPSLKSLDKVLDPPYMGLWPLLGVLLGIYEAKERKPSSSRFFIFTALLTVVYLLIHPLLYLTVIRHIPLLSGMTNIGRLFEVYQFSLSVLGAFAVDFIIHRDEHSLVFVRKIVRRLVIVLAVFFTLLGIGRVFIFQHQTWVRQKIESSLHASHAPTIFIDNVQAFQNRRVEEFFLFIRQGISIANPHLLFPLVLLLVLGAIIYAYQIRKVSKNSFQWLLVLFVCVDLGNGVGLGLRTSAPQELMKDSRIVKILHQDPEPFRVMMVEDKTKSFNSFFLVPQSNMIYGLATPDAYEPLYIKRYVDFYTWLTKREDYPVGFVMHPMHHFDKALADFSNVKYFITSAANDQLEKNPAYGKIFDGVDYRVYRNRDAMSRAFLVHKAHFARNSEEAAAYIRAFPDRLKHEIVLTLNVQNPPTVSSQKSASDLVYIKKYEPNRVEIDVHAESAGFLVISDTYYPGWRAWVDGKKQPILLADYAFRGISIPQGNHNLILRYEPKSLAMGTAASLATVLVLLIVSKIGT